MHVVVLLYRNLCDLNTVYQFNNNIIHSSNAYNPLINEFSLIMITYALTELPCVTSATLTVNFTTCGILTTSL